MSEREPPPSRRKALTLDKGIARAVEVLREHGIETCQSCEGGKGHAYPEPTIEFYGRAGAGWQALSVCLTYGFPVSELRRTWPVMDGVPTGPYWVLTFTRRIEWPEK